MIGRAYSHILDKFPIKFARLLWWCWELRKVSKNADSFDITPNFALGFQQAHPLQFRAVDVHPFKASAGHTPLPPLLLGICSRNVNIHRAWRQNEEGDRAGANGAVLLCGAQRWGHGEGWMPGWAVQQPPLRSQLLPQVCLVEDMSQPMERERKHPSLVWSRAKPVVESAGVWMCNSVI